MYTVLVISGHPDDMEIACAGTLLKCKERGDRVVVCHLSIGINKIDKMLRMPNCPFAFFVGAKKLVKRKEFEKYISNTIAI